MSIEDVLFEAEEGSNPSGHVLEGLSEEDFSELALFAADETPENDTITFDELKSSPGGCFN